MRAADVLLALIAAVSSIICVPLPAKRQDANPFAGKKLFANPEWAAKLDQTHDAFASRGDGANAEKVRAIQDIGTFVWVSNIASLPNIDAAVAAARAVQDETGTPQVVGLVLYNLPDRDCSAGESAGELDSENGGLERYKTEYLAPGPDKLSAASDLTFAVVLEPDSLANLVTNLEVELCNKAQDVYKQGIATAIRSLQFPNVHLYIDAAHGGWLGWDDNLEPTAKVFGEVVRLAGNGTKIRGFSTNVSNYNPFHATVRENFTEYSNAWDESHYADALAPFLEAEGLPSRFIIDQGRVAAPGAREEWGDWCNVSPRGSGFGPARLIVWIKPGGESDGECGYEGAPRAGVWFDEYVQMLVENADPSV
ncbi:hypothetical protein PG994_002627 [Apiospora phragmitis]|uniref:Glucanase n=1 Tax=Apiospora phragmitis TaxID=2905665 RepID=A0ABR1W5P1_9PEZI